MNTPPVQLHGPHQRLDVLDALRGVAALSVFFAHAATLLPWPSWKVFIMEYLEFGQLGVILFFLTSGFVIPISIEALTLRQFWVRRVVRIYPMYWCSLVLVIGLALRGVPNPLTSNINHLSSSAVLLNFTLLQRLFGVTDIRDVYWTLFVEMVFYSVATLLVFLKQYHRSVIAAIVIMLGAIVIERLGVQTDDETHHTLMYIGVMFFGTVLYRVTTGAATWPMALVTGGICFLMLFTSPTTSLILQTRLVAVMFFIIMLVLRPSARPLVYIGRISYSFYLLHGFAIHTISTANIWLSFALWFGCTVLVAHLSYQWIEHPAMLLGKRWQRSLTKHTVPHLAHEP